MKKIKLLIAEDDIEIREKILDFFKEDEQIEVVGATDNGITAMEMLTGENPDCVLIDLVMPRLDGFGVLSEINRKGIDVVSIMMSEYATKNFIDKAIQNGAAYFMAKPIELAVARMRILELCMEKASQSSNVSFQVKPFEYEYAPRQRFNLDEKLANIFITVGIPAHIKGYHFLREAVKMAVEKPEIINSITKKLYPSIAEKNQTTPSKVERAIRHAIEVAWNRGKIENINNVFGLKIYNSDEKPTNGEFIALVADKMLLEGAC